MTGFVDPRRLVVGAAVLAALLAPFYLFVLRSDGTEGTPRARLLDTPSADGVAHGVGLDAGELAPDFEVSTTEGGRARLSSLRGRPVLINFWAAWCASCLTEMPVIKEAQQEQGVDAFIVLAVNAGETRERALEFVNFLDAPFVYGLDPDLHVADAYGVYGLPLSVFIDARGVVQAAYSGHADRARLGVYLAAAIEGRPPGPQPFALRPVSTIPRERLLLVERHGSGRLRFTSRSLRCDASYCADSVVDDLRAVAGVLGVELTREGEPAMVLRFDPSALDEAAAVKLVVAALQSQMDPVYTRPVEVRYEG